MYERHIFSVIKQRIMEERRFIQVLAGPRQVGKTEIVRQIMASIGVPAHYATADSPTLKDDVWLAQQWALGRLRLNHADSAEWGLLVLDEIQKIPAWSEIVKRLWDEDSAAGIKLKVILLGSSPLLLQRGLGDSLAGRFETIHVTHWNYIEMQEAFGFSLEQFIFFGGYPGAASLITDKSRWSQYILESLIETTLSRDILLLTRVDKPALLRRLFQLGCHYSGQILSFQKMLGQLHDSGNASTLAHYLKLLEGAGMITGLSKYAGQIFRQKASSPKLQVLNTALFTAQANHDLVSAQQDRDFWGRLVESAVGAHLINSIKGTQIELFYWRERNKEVDFILRHGDVLTAIEVKSGSKHDTLPGMQEFSKQFKPKNLLLVGEQGLSLDTFFKMGIYDIVGSL